MGSRGLEIWVSSTSFQKSNIGWPKQPPTEKVLKFNMIFHDSTKKLSFSKHQCKAEFKNLDDSEVLSSDFPGLKKLCNLNDLDSLNNLSGLNDLNSLISSKILLTWWLDHPYHQNDQYQFLFENKILKNPIFLISDTLSVGGCGGQPMLLF